MASNNTLLGSGVVKEKKVAKKENLSEGWPKRLYREDYPAGKVVPTLKEQEEHYKDGWVESPANIKKED